MAARRQSRKGAKRKPAKKTSKRKTTKKKPVKKKITRKKPVKKRLKKRPGRRPAARKRPARKKPARKKPVKRPAAKQTKPRQPSAPVIPPGTQPIGRVIHYYSHLNVAVISLDKGPLQVGDVVHIKGHTTDFRQPVESMQVEHESIIKAVPGDDFGLKVIAHAREHDIVYRVLNP
jgi:hypothetical protein